MDQQLINLIAGILISVVLFLAAWVISRYYARSSERVFMKQFWEYLKGHEDIAPLYYFSRDRHFTLAVISYINWARQVIGFSTPAPAILPNLKGTYTFGDKDVRASASITQFWSDWLKNSKRLGAPTNDGSSVWSLVEKRVRQGNNITCFFHYHSFNRNIFKYLLWPPRLLKFWQFLFYRIAIRRLKNTGWEKSKVNSTKNFSLEVFINNYSKRLNSSYVRNYLLFLMNKEKRSPDEEEALADLLIFLYWDKKYRDCFDSVSDPWGATLHDLVKFTKFPFAVVEPEYLKTDERIAKGENVNLFSTAGGAWLLKYTVNKLEENEEYYPSLISNQERLGKDKAPVHYTDFWQNLDRINTGDKPFFVFLEHPFHDRVLWEIARGENLRYPAEILVNRKAFWERYKNKGKVRIVWLRDPVFYIGHMQSLKKNEYGKDSYDFYYQIFSSFGRTRLSSRFIASGPPLWENKGIIYSILGNPFKFGDVKEKIIDNRMRRINEFRGEVDLFYKLNIDLVARESLSRQLAIQTLIENAGSKNLSIDDLLRLPWLDMGGNDLLEIEQQVDFSNPTTWMGRGLLTLFKHESEMAYKLLAAVKILYESFSKAPSETRIRSEKCPSLEDSIKLIKEYIDQYYISEIENICEFIENMKETLKLSNLNIRQFEDSITSIKNNIKKIKIVSDESWIDNQNTRV